MSLYVEKPPVYDIREYTEASHNELVEWLGTKVTVVVLGSIGYVGAYGYGHSVNFGDYLLLSPAGFFHTLTAAEYEAKYEAVQ